MWPSSLSTTNSTISSGTNENIYLLGILSSGVLPVIVKTGIGSTAVYTRYTSSDNGTTWTNVGNITLPNSGVTTDFYMSDAPFILFNGAYYIAISGKDSSGTKVCKYYKTTDFSKWKEITLQ